MKIKVLLFLTKNSLRTTLKKSGSTKKSNQKYKYIPLYLCLEGIEGFTFLTLTI